jgi:hypothetical protein
MIVYSNFNGIIPHLGIELLNVLGWNSKIGEMRLFFSSDKARPGQVRKELSYYIQVSGNRANFQGSADMPNEFIVEIPEQKTSQILRKLKINKLNNLDNC